MIGIKLTKYAIHLALFLMVLFSFQNLSAQDKINEEGKDTKEKIVEKAKKGRLPVIIIPGLIGSELVNKKQAIRFGLISDVRKGDDMRLPITSNLRKNRDSLIPGDILRSIQVIRFTPEIGYLRRSDQIANKRWLYRRQN